jgi:hypothetical protein
VSRATKVAAKKPGAPDTRRDGFIRALAQYLVGNQAQMSILLQMGKPEAVLWSQMRGQTPLFGYPTVEEAEKSLRAWFDSGMTG